MSGLEAYEDMNMKVYTWDQEFGDFDTTLANLKSLLEGEDGEQLSDVFGMDEVPFLQRLKAGECMHGRLTAYGRAEDIWISTDAAKIQAIKAREDKKDK